MGVRPLLMGVVPLLMGVAPLLIGVVPLFIGVVHLLIGVVPLLIGGSLGGRQPPLVLPNLFRQPDQHYVMMTLTLWKGRLIFLVKSYIIYSRKPIFLSLSICIYTVAGLN